MPFTGFSKSALQEKYPATFGVARGKPNVAIAGNGRIQFSSEATKVLAGCKVVIPSCDKENNFLRFDGFDKAPAGKEDKAWDIVWPKAGKDGKATKNKQASLAGTLILKEMNYDYKAAGNQNYDIEKLDEAKHVLIFALPKKTPAMRPKVERKKKTPPAPPAAPAGAAKPAAGGGGIDDVVIDS